MKISPVILLAMLIALSPAKLQATDDPIVSLESWLKLPVDNRPALDHEQDFATAPLTKSQAAKAANLLWADYTKQLEKNQKDDWENKIVRHGDIEMKFDFKTFGERPDDGRSLFISMHGGGGAPAAVNEQQWRNQIRLYEPEEGVYLAPRAPTDTWNLWHQSHIDKLFAQLIQNAVQFEDVNPNKVYLMGYSAGGDGVYQLAPRMADYFAAAAMMAGHPNNASPISLRNIGFTLHMGGDDSAYNRNKVAADWKKALADLREDDPDGYQHEVVIHEGLGHWMNREDAVAVPWMAKFRRNPLPDKVVWRQSGVTHAQFYWLAVDKDNEKGNSEIIVTRDEGGSLNVEKVSGVEVFSILLNDEMVDLDDQVKIKTPWSEDFVEVKPVRTISTLSRTLDQRCDRQLMFSAEAAINQEQN